jgi:hypothetical protein
MLTQHLCRFCGEQIRWGDILRLIRVDPDTPPHMLSESACHIECLTGVLRHDVPLTFHRHWMGKGPLLDDREEIDGQPCAICAEAIAPARLVRLRIQRPTGRIKAPEFDEQSLPVHLECLAAVSMSRLL